MYSTDKMPSAISAKQSSVATQMIHEGMSLGPLFLSRLSGFFQLPLALFSSDLLQRLERFSSAFFTLLLPFVVGHVTSRGDQVVTPLCNLLPDVVAAVPFGTVHELLAATFGISPEKSEV